MISKFFNEKIVYIKSQNANIKKELPDITFISCFTKNRNDLERINTQRKIFFTGEDVHKNYIQFNDLFVNHCDLSIGFDYEKNVKAKNYVRYPLWLLYYFGHLNTLEEIQKEVDSFNNRVFKKTKFCTLIASHDKFVHHIKYFTKIYNFIMKRMNKNFNPNDRKGVRYKLIKLLNPITSVMSAGKIYHNDDSLKTEFADNKIEYMKQFMFNICPENVSTPGYVTEKIFQSFDAGCIPIYYGSEGIVEPEVINPKAIILYNGKNNKEVLKKVKKLYTDKNAYSEFLQNKPLLPTAAKWIYERNQELKRRISEIESQKLK